MLRGTAKEFDDTTKNTSNYGAGPVIQNGGDGKDARIHYYRSDGNYTNWSLYTFNDTQESTNNFNEGPLFVSGTDMYGAFFDVKVKAGAVDLGFIVHNVSTGAKDPGPDMHLSLTKPIPEAWILSGDSTVYTVQLTAVQILSNGFSRLQAYWLDRQTVAIAPAYVHAGWIYQLLYSPDASLQITSSFGISGASALALTAPGSLSTPQLQKYPQLKTYAALRLPIGTEVAKLKAALKGQMALAAFSGNSLKYITGVQTAGVLDDLFYYSGPLGGNFGNGQSPSLSVSVWAPTAQSIQLLMFQNANDTKPATAVSMSEANGTWSADLDSSWRNKYYLFSVKVYVPSLHQIVTNVVTDPYSVDLSLNGIKSRLTDLSDPRTKPDDWDEHRSPEIQSKNELTIWELHVRDFSASDASVPAERRGTYLGFADPHTNGMRHLQRLSNAGLKAVHLLPTFHISSINEDKTTWKSPDNLTGYPPDGQQQQAAVAAVQNQDAFNWGYDPIHFMAPEGSYAVNPDDRVKEYRAMVEGLHRAGLRVIQDQVFNHTTSSGQAADSVLDRIVPAYYYRLDHDGNVLNNSCCSDTASEHLMMEKLMIDSVIQNARQYKIDGFRFDLMSFHFVYNLQHIQNALAQLTLERDGVDGSKIYLYGEGWTTGETANNALGPNASQANMYGTGIGTFNDRIRDGVRGGGPFSDQRVQGFASGLFTESSIYTQQNQTHADQLTALLKESDWIRAGLAGNMRDFSFVDSWGVITKAGSLDYMDERVGYTASPIESVNYCSVHDNQTLFDALQLKTSAADNIAARARRQVVAMSLIALGQGIPFFHAGDELLRSKDMDNNSYNAGDWFNRLDFTYQSNNWGTGLPLAADNEENWPIMRPLLADASLKPTNADIIHTRDAFEALLAIRASSGLFRMQTLPEVQSNLHFLNTGSQQVPGVIAMRLGANGGRYGPYQHIFVVFNATNKPVTLQDNSLKGSRFVLHPLLRDASDAIVKTSSFDRINGAATVPALTTAVFVN